MAFGELFSHAAASAGGPWWTTYEDEAGLKGFAAVETFGADGATEVAREHSEEAIHDALSASLDETTDEGVAAMLAAATPTSEEETAEAIRSAFPFTRSFLATVHSVLAMMVHGRSMCQLVAEAKKGDDESFVRAVRVDRMVLQLPYSRERMIRAQFTGDSVFLNRLSFRLREPPLKSKIRHRKLWLTFAILDDQELFNLPHNELFDIGQGLGV